MAIWYSVYSISELERIILFMSLFAFNCLENWFSMNWNCTKSILFINIPDFLLKLILIISQYKWNNYNLPPPWRLILHKRLSYTPLMHQLPIVLTWDLTIYNYTKYTKSCFFFTNKVGNSQRNVLHYLLNILPLLLVYKCQYFIITLRSCKHIF